MSTGLAYWWYEDYIVFSRNECLGILPKAKRKGDKWNFAINFPDYLAPSGRNLGNLGSIPAFSPNSRLGTYGFTQKIGDLRPMLPHMHYTCHPGKITVFAGVQAKEIGPAGVFSYAIPLFPFQLDSQWWIYASPLHSNCFPSCPFPPRSQTGTTLKLFAGVRSHLPIYRRFYHLGIR